MSTLRETSGEFLDHLQAWQSRLQSLSLDALLIEAGGGPECIAVFCVDVMQGLCPGGAPYRERVRRIIAPIDDLFTRANDVGIWHFVLIREESLPEARALPHASVSARREPEAVSITPALTRLPFASEFMLLDRKELCPAVGTGLDTWLYNRPEVTHRIVVGDCTDLCVYQLAMHLQLRAMAEGEVRPVIVPADCVAIYDLLVAVAQAKNLYPHPADLFQAMSLYSMACNGIRVVSRIA
jgi:nicotinamidase-related amidase